jgi:hypothetical protein
MSIFQGLPMTQWHFTHFTVVREAINMRAKHILSSTKAAGRPTTMELTPPSTSSTPVESKIVRPNIVTGALEHVTFRKLRPQELTFLDLPAEIRNNTYHHLFVRQARRTPRNPSKNNTPDGGFAIFRVHSAIYAEAKSYFTTRARAYLPIKSGSPLFNPENGWLSPVAALNETYTEALRTIPDIHFHLRPNGADPSGSVFPNLMVTLRKLSEYSRLYHSGMNRYALIHLAWRPYDFVTSSIMSACEDPDSEKEESSGLRDETYQPNQVSDLVSTIAENTLEEFTVCYWTNSDSNYLTTTRKRVRY